MNLLCFPARSPTCNLEQHFAAMEARRWPSLGAGHDALPISSASAPRQGLEIINWISSDCGIGPKGSLARLHHHFDGVLDAVARVAQCPRQLVESKGVRVDEARVKALGAHERLRAMGGAAAFAANPVDIDVVAHEMRHVDQHGLVREGGEAHLAAAVEHAPGCVDGVGGTRALDDIIDALAAVQSQYGLNRI